MQVLSVTIRERLMFVEINVFNQRPNPDFIRAKNKWRGRKNDFKLSLLFSSHSWCFLRKLSSRARHTRSTATLLTPPPCSSHLSYPSRWCEDGEYVRRRAPCRGLISTCSAACQFDQTCSAAFPFGPPTRSACWRPLCSRMSWFDS